MKQISIALVMIGMMHSSANAQGKNHRSDINYKVCQTNTGYQVCSGAYNGLNQKKATTTTTYTVNNEDNGVIPESRGRSKYDVNYKVCKIDEQYKICNPNDALIQTTNNPGQIAGVHSVNTGEAASLSMNEGGVYMGYTSKKNSTIKVQDEDNLSDKLDKEADGKEKASYRNMNYNNGSVSLPPSDGGLSDR
jgi:hypothetical protein